MRAKKELNAVEKEVLTSLDDLIPKLDKSDQDKVLGFLLGITAMKEYREKEKTPA